MLRSDSECCSEVYKEGWCTWLRHMPLTCSTCCQGSIKVTRTLHSTWRRNEQQKRNKSGFVIPLAKKLQTKQFPLLQSLNRRSPSPTKVYASPSSLRAACVRQWEPLLLRKCLGCAGFFQTCQQRCAFCNSQGYPKPLTLHQACWVHITKLCGIMFLPAT